MQADIQLLEAWRTGDKRAGNELVERYFDQIYLFSATRSTPPRSTISRSAPSCDVSRPVMPFAATHPFASTCSRSRATSCTSTCEDANASRVPWTSPRFRSRPSGRHRVASPFGDESTHCSCRRFDAFRSAIRSPSSCTSGKTARAPRSPSSSASRKARHARGSGAVASPSPRKSRPCGTEDRPWMPATRISRHGRASCVRWLARVWASSLRPPPNKISPR